MYIGNIPFKLNEEQLGSKFNKYGKIVDCVIPKKGRHSRGFGFVTFEDPSAAARALKKMNRKTVKGRQIRVEKARQKIEKPSKKRKSTNKQNKKNQEDKQIKNNKLVKGNIVVKRAPPPKNLVKRAVSSKKKAGQKNKSPQKKSLKKKPLKKKPTKKTQTEEKKKKSKKRPGKLFLCFFF